MSIRHLIPLVGTSFLLIVIGVIVMHNRGSSSATLPPAQEQPDTTMTLKTAPPVEPNSGPSDKTPPTPDDTKRLRHVEIILADLA